MAKNKKGVRHHLTEIENLVHEVMVLNAKNIHELEKPNPSLSLIHLKLMGVIAIIEELNEPTKSLLEERK